MRLQVRCEGCGAVNVVSLPTNFNLIEDTLRCGCGTALQTPTVTQMSYPWNPSKVVKQAVLDPVSGKFRKAVDIFPVCRPEDMLVEGAVMVVFGDTDEAALSLAQHVCNWHNGRISTRHVAE